MSARPTNGARPLNRLRDEMDQLFENFFGPMATWSPLTGGARTFPPLNIWEDDNNLYAEAELPGMTMDDLEVYVVGNELTIMGERKGSQDGNFHRRERPIGAFLRTVTLPMPIDANRVEATLRDGVLMITMPKSEIAKPRKIQVKSA
jgi:HSP20 family protein